MATLSQATNQTISDQALISQNISDDELISLILHSDDVQGSLVTLQENLASTLQNIGHYNTGRSSQLRNDIGNNYIKVYAVFYLFILEEGAKFTSKGPPIDKIEEWIEQRGIVPEGKQTTRQLAFAISKHIKKYGLKPNPNLLTKLREDFKNDIIKIVAEQTKMILLSLISNRNK